MEDFLERAVIGFSFSAGVGLLFALFPRMLSDSMYRLMGAPATVIEIGSQYFVYRLTAFPFDLMSEDLDEVIKATGDTKSPMVIHISSTSC
jgi:Na+-driven multidrug efflux pump